MPGRKLTVALPSQFVDAIITHKEGTRAWTRAVFFAAHIMVHEIGHVVYWQSLEEKRGMTKLYEPRFHEDLENELGDSLMAQIFSGWLIQPISMNDGSSPPAMDQNFHADMMGFQKSGFYWVKQPRSGDSDFDAKTGKPPAIKTCYSIPFREIEKYTQSEFWEESYSREKHVLDRFRVSVFP